MIEQAKFIYSPPRKTFKKQTKTRKRPRKKVDKTKEPK